MKLNILSWQSQILFEVASVQHTWQAAALDLSVKAAMSPGSHLEKREQEAVPPTLMKVCGGHGFGLGLWPVGHKISSAL